MSESSALRERVMDVLEKTEGQLPRISGCRPSSQDVMAYLLAHIVIKLEDIENAIATEEL